MNALLTSSLRSLAVIAALASTASAVSAETTLRISYSPISLQYLYEKVGAAFEEQFPDINIEFVPSERYDDLVQQTLRASITDTLPDVSHQGMNQLRTLVDRELLVPLDRFIALESDWEDQGYLAASADMSSYNDATYGLPFAISVPVIFYNAELVREAGGDPDNLPQSWPAIIDLAERIDDLGPMGIWFDYQASSAWPFQTLVFSQGGRMLSEDENVIAFDGPEGEWAFDLLRRFGEAGQIDMTRQQARQSFGAGELGIYQNASSLLTRFQEAADGRFEVLMQPVPMAAGGRLPAAGNAVAMLTTEEERQAAAWEYIKFVTGPIGQSIVAQNTGYVPANMAAIEGLRDFYAANPQSRNAVDALGSMTTWYAFPGENSVRITETIREGMRTAITLEKEPGEALSDLAEQVDELLP
ncbi:MAG: ABC transporter substrate-binding protein [Hyphomonas sp.]|nr:ABC transporter substrate-binding protein [Hyphomonas sp.]